MLIFIHMNELSTRINPPTRALVNLFLSRPKKQTAKYFTLGISDKTLLSDAKANMEIVYGDGFGIKLIARELNMPYSITRTFLIKVLGVSIRRGYRVVTERLRVFRSEKAKRENLGKCWPEKYIKSNKGAQGYYWNKFFNKYCWLRSSYEYIYAKFLDKKNIKWNSEEKYFMLSNGEKYLPDFFIYDGAELKYVVEFKGYYKLYDRGKQDMFTEFPIIIVRDIKTYLDIGSNLTRELKLWKQIKISKLPE